ncbi:hypothetical protein [Flagellimonas sp. SN16]|uniref:terminase small subunit-like protein n=1 Tax=Flagellimonas sp. SN16 TaxID=3415142 RepID=UPI003C56BF44
MAYSKENKKEIVDFICNEIAEGKSLRQVFKENEELPDTKTFYSWIDDDEEKLQQYARATEHRQDLIFEDILNIADTPKIGIKTKTTEKGIETMEGDMIEHRRLQVDARKWMLAKMNPKKYGDKVFQDHTTDGKPLKIISLGNGIDPDKTSPEAE